MQREIILKFVQNTSTKLIVDSDIHVLMSNTWAVSDIFLFILFIKFKDKVDIKKYF